MTEIAKNLLFHACFVFACVFLIHANVNAQQSPIAFVKVDINVERLLSNESFSDLMEQLPTENYLFAPRSVDLALSDIKRVTLAAAPSAIDFALLAREHGKTLNDMSNKLFDLPNGVRLDREERAKRREEFDAFQKQQVEELQKQPIEFYVKIEFSSENIARLLVEKLSRDFTEDQIDGKSIFRFWAGKAIGIYFDGQTNLTIASNKYLFDVSALELSQTVKQHFSENPNQAIRAAINLDDARSQISRFMETDEELVVLSDFVDLIKSATLAADLEGQRLVGVKVNAKNKTDAETIVSQINGLLQRLKRLALRTVNQLLDQNNATRNEWAKWFNSMEFSVDGTSANINIEKPAEFDAMLLKAINNASTVAARKEKLSCFRQIGIAIHDFHDAYDRLPFAEPAHRGGNKDLSWRVFILPGNRNKDLYQQFKLDEPWNSEANKPLVKRMTEHFGLGETGEKTSICWVKVSDKALKFSDIKDGLDYTIMLMQNPNKVVWSKPGDLTIDEAVALVKNLKDGEEIIVSTYRTVGYVITNKMDIETLKAMLTIDGGEEVDLSKIK